MNWVVYIVLMAAYLAACITGGIRRQTASWYWTAVGMCVVLAGWTFMAMGSVLSPVIWLAFAGIWSWLSYRRVKSLRRPAEDAWSDR